MSLFKSIGLEGSAAGENYMVVDLYLSKKFGQGTPWQSAIQRSLSDLAMMGASVETQNDDYPGMHLGRAASEANGRGQLQNPIDAAAYMEDIASRCGWPSLNSATEDAIHETEEHLKALPQDNTMWTSILRAVFATHLAFLRLRKQFPGILADFDVYRANLPHLPPMPILEDNGHIKAGGLTQADAESFATWFLFEHIERQLLFSTRLPCPISANGLHKCGGDVLKTNVWRHQDSCQFSRLVSALGLPELSAQVAS